MEIDKIYFTVDSDGADTLLHENFKQHVDYKELDNGDVIYVMNHRQYDRFVDLATSTSQEYGDSIDETDDEGYSLIDGKADKGKNVNYDTQERMIGQTIRIHKDMPYMASLSSLTGKDLKVLDVKTIGFASGTQIYYTVKVDGQEHEVPERFTEHGYKEQAANGKKIGNADSFSGDIDFKGKKLEYEVLFDYDLGTDGEWEFPILSYNGEDIREFDLGFTDSEIDEAERQVMMKIKKETKNKYYYYSNTAAKGKKVDGTYAPRIEEHSHGFSPTQTKNIEKIVDAVSSEMTGEIDSLGSGGGFYHIFIQLKDKRWIGFHAVSGDITLSEPFKTIDELYDAWNEDDGMNVTGMAPENFKSYGDGDFSPTKDAIRDIKEHNFIKIAKHGTKIGLDFNDTVNFAKAEILTDIKNGVVPNTVASFSELHDYVDANEYGGFTDNRYRPSKGMVFENKVQNELDKWIKNGGIKLKAKHGLKIENQYKDKWVADIWNSWTKEQRRHFINDHSKEYPTDEHDMIRMINQNYKDLLPGMQDLIIEHTKRGQYKHGGIAKHGLKTNDMKNNYYYLKIGNIIKEVRYGNFIQITGYDKHGVKVIEHSEIESKGGAQSWVVPFEELLGMMGDKKLVIEHTIKSEIRGIPTSMTEDLSYENSRDEALLQMEIDNIKKEFIENELKAKASTLASETFQVKKEADVLLEKLTTKTKGFEDTLAGMEAMVTNRDVPKEIDEHITRKPSEWNEVDEIPSTLVQKYIAFFKKLPILEIKKGATPFDNLGVNYKEPFITGVGKKTYLIVPEGYEYARYAVDITSSGTIKEWVRDQQKQDAHGKDVDNSIKKTGRYISPKAALSLVMKGTEDAYMRGSYGDKAWEKAARSLLIEGFHEDDVIWILNSKHARWADDEFGRGAGKKKNDGYELYDYYKKNGFKDDKGKLILPKDANGKMVGGGVEKDRYNLSFQYNPNIVKHEYAESVVEKYTKDWTHDNDWDEVSFYVRGLTKEQSDDLKKQLKTEDVYNIEVEDKAAKGKKVGGDNETDIYEVEDAYGKAHTVLLSERPLKGDTVTSIDDKKVIVKKITKSPEKAKKGAKVISEFDPEIKKSDIKKGLIVYTDSSINNDAKIISIKGNTVTLETLYDVTFEGELTEKGTQFDETKGSLMMNWIKRDKDKASKGKKVRTLGSLSAEHLNKFMDTKDNKHLKASNKYAKKSGKTPKRGKLNSAETKYKKANKKEINAMADAYPDLSYREIIVKHKSAK